MTDELPGSSVDETVSPPGPPPLRIHHFLVATAVAALLLTLAKLLVSDETMALTGYFTSGPGIVSILLGGIELTLIGFGIAWRRQGRRFFDQPGHWLLLFTLFRLVFFLAIF